MNRIAKFHKVSFPRFYRDYTETFGEMPEAEVQEIYDAISLPQRATRGSAGYDFFLTRAICLKPGEAVKIPTGIRAEMQEDYVLLLFPRSGLGFKYRLQLNNTVGVIDSDYFASDNEGHIFVKLTNDSNEGKQLQLEAGAGFAQGIFMQFGITEDDAVSAERNGGFGSTGKCV